MWKWKHKCEGSLFVSSTPVPANHNKEGYKSQAAGLPRSIEVLEEPRQDIQYCSSFCSLNHLPPSLDGTPLWKLESFATERWELNQVKVVVSVRLVLAKEHEGPLKDGRSAYLALPWSAFWESAAAAAAALGTATSSSGGGSGNGLGASVFFSSAGSSAPSFLSLPPQQPAPAATIAAMVHAGQITNAMTLH